MSKLKVKDAKKNNLVSSKEIRATIIANESLMDKVKGIAFWERKKIKDIVNSALIEFITKYEKENGEILQPPKK